MKAAKKRDPRGPVTVYVWWQGKYHKVKLSDGGIWHASSAERTDEGWRRTTELVVREGTKLVMDSYSEGRDCDGPWDDHNVYECPLRDRFHATPYGKPVPMWERVGGEVYDAYAQSMGY